MFARTQRLMLRPGWTEDAPELARAINYHEVTRNLSRAPWPYSQSDADQFLAIDRDAAALPALLICDFNGGLSRVVGAIGLDRMADGAVDLGYWLTPDVWGRGFATEAGRAMLDIARMLRVPCLTASHFTDNPASGRVLRKLGFTPTGRTVARHSLGRGGDDLTVEYELRLSPNTSGRPCPNPGHKATTRERQSASVAAHIDGRMAA